MQLFVINSHAFLSNVHMFFTPQNKQKSRRNGRDGNFGIYVYNFIAHRRADTPNIDYFSLSVSSNTAATVSSIS